MLWNAGQQRVLREGRERLVELYVGVRDGYVAGNIATGKAKARGDITPTYARQDRPATAEPIDALKARDRAFDDLARMFPAAVKRGDS